jgi:glycine/D-amino acid oxidase-like deaminating enzyme
MPDSPPDRDPSLPELPRRDFLRLAGVGTGALLSGIGAPDLAAQGAPVRRMRARPSSHVVVVGAGAWGAWISWHLRQAGSRVTMIDQYGAANSRATSGAETRGIRSSYGDRAEAGELWTAWARKSIERWRAFDAEHAKRFGTRFFLTTGDVIYRDKPETFTTRTEELWKQLGVRYESITADEARHRWPQINGEGSGIVLFGPDAGVARARDSIQAVVALGREAGVDFRIGRVRPGPMKNGQMDGVLLGDGTKVTADAYVWACGPWLPKIFPELMQSRMRIPIGHVCYFGTPPNDKRFTYPNIPSWNVPGVTGWAELPADSHGFRVRGAFAPPPPPRPAGADDAAPSPPPPSVASDPRQQDPDLSSRWTSEERVEGSRRVLQKHFPAMADAPLVETRSCHYESSVNRNFIIDRLPGIENTWIAGVGQAEGFKFSIITGEYTAWRVLGDRGDPALAEAFKLPTEEYSTAPGAPRREEE